MRTIMRAFALVVLSTLGLWIAPASAADAYPNRPIKMVVPFPPGGATDVIGRVIAQKLQERLGQPVVVDNRAGASGNIGADAVAKAPGDGYTLLMAALTSHSINSSLQRLPYDLEKDFTPVSIVGDVPLVLVVHPSVPAKTLQEFIALVKKQAGPR